jgi:hypothetical protein
MAVPRYGTPFRNVFPSPVAARRYLPFLSAFSASFMALFWAFVRASLRCLAAAMPTTTPAVEYDGNADSFGELYVGAGGVRGALGVGVTVYPGPPGVGVYGIYGAGTSAIYLRLRLIFAM